MHGLIIAAVFSATTIAAIVSVIVLRRFWAGPSRLRSAVMNALVTVLTLAYLFLALETYYYMFKIESDGFGYTLAKKRWLALYYKPINSLGYRDMEHTAETLAGKRLACVIGDSFSVGSGVKRVSDRFSSVLKRKLGDEWEVVLLAQGGWDTPKQLTALKTYSHKPELVILQYFINDIAHAARDHGVRFLVTRPSFFPPVQFVIDHSYFVNFWFWRLFRRFAPTYGQESFCERVQGCFVREEVWQDHERSLREFAAYTQREGIKLLVVVFPSLNAVAQSQPATAKVAAVFEDAQVEVLDLTPRLQDRSPDDIICNPYDAHPNERLHAEVGLLLYSRLLENGFLSDNKLSR